METNHQNTPAEISKRFRGFWYQFGKFFRELIDLREGLDKEGTIVYIKNNKTMKGAKAWLLMCSIMIASLGLDLDSPAVIIGAMLISPLMSPILGIGLSVGINDRSTLLISLRHFSIAIGISLLTSITYFLLTPIGQITPEIMARTNPTVLDVLIATFGGTAGIISGSRKDKSNAIPGVAIATALMPPLCVAGFGIANQEWLIARNAFYLFFLNSFFVALATYFIVRHLRFPYREHVDSHERILNTSLTVFFSLLMIVPSFFILRGAIRDVSVNKKSEAFISTLGNDLKYLDSYQHLHSDSGSVLLLKVYGTAMHDSLIPIYEKRLDSLGLGDTRIEIIRTSEVELGSFNRLEARLRGFEYLADQLRISQQFYLEQEEATRSLRRELDSLKNPQNSLDQLFAEAKAFYNDIESISIGTFDRVTEDTIIRIPNLFVTWRQGTPASVRREAEPKLNQWIKLHYGFDTLATMGN